MGNGVTVDVHTWADSYGVWHALVPLTGYRARDAHAARTAIIAELTEREGPRFDPSTVHVRRTEVLTATAHYTEVIEK